MPRLLDDATPEVRRAVPLLTAVRLSANTLYRFTPPFLTTIARGLGVSLDQMGVALSVSELAGLGTPVAGRAIDRSSRRVAMVMGLTLMGGAATLAALAPNVVVFAIALSAIALGKPTYDAAMGAWLADRVDYASRGRVVGLTETSWAGALLVGVPLLALVTGSVGYTWAFAALAATNGLASLAVWHMLPPDPPTGAPGSVGRLDRLRPTLPAYVALGLLASGSQFVFVVFGTWLEDSYGFSAAGIGVVSLIVGAIELAGSMGSMRFTDRIGKRRSVALGALVLVPTAIGLAVGDVPLAVGVALLALFFLGFEFAIVSAIPIIGELHPEARASSIGLAVAFMTVGRAAAALAATRLYTAHGMGGAALPAGACGAATAALMWWAVATPGRPVPD